MSGVKAGTGECWKERQNIVAAMKGATHSHATFVYWVVNDINIIHSNDCEENDPV